MKKKIIKIGVVIGLLLSLINIPPTFATEQTENEIADLYLRYGYDSASAIIDMWTLEWAQAGDWSCDLLVKIDGMGTDMKVKGYWGAECRLENLNTGEYIWFFDKGPISFEEEGTEEWIILWDTTVIKNIPKGYYELMCYVHIYGSSFYWSEEYQDWVPSGHTPRAEEGPLYNRIRFPVHGYVEGTQINME